MLACSTIHCWEKFFRCCQWGFTYLIISCMFVLWDSVHFEWSLNFFSESLGHLLTFKPSYLPHDTDLDEPMDLKTEMWLELPLQFRIRMVQQKLVYNAKESAPGNSHEFFCPDETLWQYSMKSHRYHDDQQQIVFEAILLIAWRHQNHYELQYFIAIQCRSQTQAIP